MNVESIIETKTVTFAEGVEIMTKAEYPLDLFVDRWHAWLGRGDIVIIFENHDLGHRDLGHVITMPWDPKDPLPRHAPDHAQTGLGWRYLPAYKITKDE